MFVLGVFFSKIVKVMINWQQDFAMPNFVYNHTCDWQIRPPLLSCLIFLITGMIIDQIGFHSLLLPLFIGQLQICG